MNDEQLSVASGATDIRGALRAILARPVAEVMIQRQPAAVEPEPAPVASPGYKRRRPRPVFDRQAVGDDLARGLPVKDIASAHGISPTTVKVIRKELGLTYVPVPAYDHAGALRDLDAGQSAIQVAARYGVDPQTIRALRRVRNERRGP